MRWLVIVLALVLGGCAPREVPSAATLQAERTYPANYKAEIMAYLRTFLNDPSNVRNAYVSEPTLIRLQGEDRYINCVRFEAKSGPGSRRSRDHMAIYFGGKLEHFVDLRGGGRAEKEERDEKDEKEEKDTRSGGKDDNCRSAAYQPFPELEHLTR